MNIVGTNPTPVSHSLFPGLFGPILLVCCCGRMLIPLTSSRNIIVTARMTSALHKRLQRLEELVAARVAPPIWRWQMDPNGDAAAELDRLVADGVVTEKDRGRVQLWRWLTREEALARGIVHPEPPPPKPAPALPAPPELKLLPAPAPEPQQPPAEPPPQVQAKRPLTEEQMPKLLETRERPFGKPIRYPKGMATP